MEETKKPDMEWLISDMSFPSDPTNGRRIINLLRRGGIFTLRQLLESSEDEVWALKYFNATCRVLLRDKLAEYGLELPQSRPQW